MSPNEAYPVPVACLVLVDSTKTVLATRRPEHKALGGLWEFPGGKLDDGESAENALRREIREELHLELGPLSPLSPVLHRYPFGVIRLIPFLACCDKRPVLRLAEHTAAEWVTLKEASLLEWAPADLPILAELAQLGVIPGTATNG
jgi:8-oxo-dGTP diphosphatase